MIMKKKLLVGLATGMMMLGMVGVVEATLIEQDLATAPAGNKYITHDTETGLSWLDVNLTQGQSCNDVLHGEYAGQGFRYARVEELSTLFALMGVPSTPGTNTTSGDSNPDYLPDMFKLGLTHNNDWGTYGHEYLIEGIYGFQIDEWGGNNYLSTYVVFHTTKTRPWGLESTDNSYPHDYTYPNAVEVNNLRITAWGSWLVRGDSSPVPVPEPATILFLFAGVVTIAVTGIRRKPVREHG